MSTEPASGPRPAAGGRLLVVVLVVVAVAPFVPMLLEGHVPLFRDHLDYFAPLRYFTAMELRSGSLPLWNPYNGSGEAWLANPQTGIFYPPSWIFVVVPFVTAYVLHLAFHLALAAVGAYRMLLTRLSPESAFVGALAFMLCGPLYSLVDVNNNLASFAWMPWVLHAAIVRAPARRAGTVIALSFLAGEPFYAAFGALLYVVIVREWRKVLPAALIAAGLSAAQLLPFVEMVAGSDRAAGLPPSQIFRDSASVGDWLRLFVPPRLTPDIVDPALSQHFITIVYCGVVTGILALLALLLVRRAFVLWWSVLLAIAFCISIAPQLPPVAWLLEHSPVTLFRYPARLIPVGALALAALAAAGWDRIRPGRRWADVLVACVIVAELAPVSFRLLASSPFNTNPAGHAAATGTGTKMLRVAQNAGSDRHAWIAGYLNLYGRRFDSWSAAPLMPERYLRLFDEVFSGTRLDLIDRFPAGWILIDRPLDVRYELTGQVRNVRVYRNRHALPMASVWTAVRPASNADEALRGALDPRFAGDLFISPPPPATYAGRERKIAPASITRISGHEVRVTSNSPLPGVLVLMQRDAPGWRVTVDGRPAQKLLADGNFRAVAIDSGPHVIEWTYRPASLLSGLSMTIVTLVSMILCSFVKRSAARKFSS